MNTQSTATDFRLPIPDAAPGRSYVHVRVVYLPIEQGRLYTATPGAYTEKSIGVRVTPGGHWYRSDDQRFGFHADIVRCRGCQMQGHVDFAGSRCPRPASAQDITTALLLESWPLARPRPKPYSPRGFYRAFRRELLEAAA